MILGSILSASSHYFSHLAGCTLMPRAQTLADRLASPTWTQAMEVLADTPPGGMVLYDDESISAYSSGTKPALPYKMVAGGMPGWFSMKCGTATYGPFDGTKTTLLDVAFDVKYGSDPEYERVEGKKAGTRNYRKKGTSGRGTTINVNAYRPRSLYVPELSCAPKRPAPSSDGGAAKKNHLASSAEQTKTYISDADVAAFELPANLDDAFGPPPADDSSTPSADDALARLLEGEEAYFDELIAAFDDNDATAMMGQLQ